MVGFNSTVVLPGSFQPNWLSGNCSLWLRSDLGVTQSSGVTGWSDQTSNTNNASASGAGKPSYQTNILNGYPAIRTDGATTFMSITDATTLNMGTGSFDVFVVVVPHKVAAFQTLIGKAGAGTANNIRFMISGTNHADIFWGNDGQAYSGGGGSGTTASGTGAMIEWGLLSNGASSSERTAIGTSNSVTTVTVSGTGSNALAMIIGSDTTPQYFAQYDYLEIIMYKGLYLSASQRAQLTSYFANRYGSAIAA